ncbi:MAG: hypothetical protein LH624_01015, partial [Cryobacterium sp.]|nr:hypothetical protein [Cryobacterium sp.]
ASAPQPKSSPSYSRTQQIKPVLRPPPESAGSDTDRFRDGRDTGELQALEDLEKDLEVLHSNARRRSSQRVYRR